MLQQLMARPPTVSLAVAESVTGGRIQALVTAESGASAFFRGGITAYTLAAKMRLLGVERAVAEPVDCVSAAVAWQMARGVGALFGADLGVATTGYAELPPGRHDLSTPCVYWALCHRCGDGAEIRKEGLLVFPGAARGAVQTEAAAAVYAALADYLRNYRGLT